MRKILLATTALAAVSMASSAFAMTDADVKINGSYDFGWFSLSDDYKGLGDDDKTYGAGGVTIRAEATGDNGLTYGMSGAVDFQDNNHTRNTGRAKERDSGNTHIFVKGDFGTVTFGHQGNSKMGIGAPTHAGTYGADDIRDAGSFLVPGGAGDVNDVRVGTGLISSPQAPGGNDDAKIKYVSPSFSGFQFAADVQDSDSEGNEMAIGASFTTDLAGGTLKIAGHNFSNDKDGAAEDAGNSLGASFSSGAFTVTLTSFDGNEPIDQLTSTNTEMVDANDPTKGWKASDVTKVNADQEALMFGLGFKVSDQLEVGASHTTAENSASGATRVDTEGTFTSVSGSYTIAPGLKTQLGISSFEVEDKRHVGTKNEGSSVTWELRFSF